jgi:hypothetical protein
MNRRNDEILLTIVQRLLQASPLELRGISIHRVDNGYSVEFDALVTVEALQQYVTPVSGAVHVNRIPENSQTLAQAVNSGEVALDRVNVGGQTYVPTNLSDNDITLEPVLDGDQLAEAMQSVPDTIPTPKAPTRALRPRGPNGKFATREEKDPQPITLVKTERPAGPPVYDQAELNKFWNQRLEESGEIGI